MTPLELLLTEGTIRPLGRIVESSNSAVLVEVTRGGERALAIHKPVAFERALWDYPDGCLAFRERAAYLISVAGGFEQVPTTVLRDGPWGPGALQAWVGDPEQEVDAVVTVCEPEACPPEWIVVMVGEDQDGHEVALAHAPDPDVRSVAVLDAVLNNSDRKGGHLLRAGERVQGIDHGVSLGVEPKLRTVLWGWAGADIADADLTRVERLRGVLDGPRLTELADLLTDAERAALRDRCQALRRVRRHPSPRPGWPAIPWPAI